MDLEKLSTTDKKYEAPQEAVVQYGPHKSQ